MATYLRVVLATCVSILLCFPLIFARGIGRHDELVEKTNVREDDFDINTRHLVRRAAIQPALGPGGGAGGAVDNAQALGGRADAYQQGGRQGPPRVVPDQGLGQQAAQFPNRMRMMQPGQMAPQGQQFQGQNYQDQLANNVQVQQQQGGFPDARFRQRQPQPGQENVQRPAPPLVPKKKPLRPAAMKPVRLADHPSCISDVQHLCAQLSKGNNFAILDCLQKGEGDLSPDCNHFLWNYKMNLTLDYRFDNAASEVCREDRRKFADCQDLEAGKGLILPCLFEHAGEISNQQCMQYLNRMKEITFSDYRLIRGFYETCSADIAQYSCGTVNENGNAQPRKAPPHSQGGTIHCLEKNVQSLQEDCRKQILRVAELSANDYHQDRALYYACNEDRERFCPGETAGEGRVYKCLQNNKFNKAMSPACREKLTTRQKLVAQDYKVNFRLQRKCKKEIEDADCNMGVTKGKDMMLAHILICLEQYAREEEKELSGDCQAELIDSRKQLMSDYMINPEIMTNCQTEIETECKGLRREGRTIHCLMGLTKKGNLGKQCKKALQDLVEEADAGSDYRMDPALHEACKATRDKLCAKKSDAEVLSCLMENIDDDAMDDNCAEELLQIQYFISRNFKLDPVLFKNCKQDAQNLCYEENWAGDGNSPNGLIFACLHRHLHNAQSPLQPRCVDQVHRVLRLRAVSVHLNPRIEEECRTDIGQFCNEKSKRGEELQCLQDHLQDLRVPCKTAIGNFTVEEAEDIHMNRKLIASCAPMLRKFCQEKLKEKRVDEGDALKCLIEHKNDDEMEPKCQAGIEHFQLIQLKDYRFSFKFKESCRKDVLKLCKGSKDKAAIINCLSSKVRDAILRDESPQVQEECRKQLKFELLQRDENIELDPELQKECGKDIRNHCSQIKQGDARVMECLRAHQKELSDSCHVKLFNREKEMADKPDIDYALMHSCKKTIKTKCKDVAPEKLVDCLKSHKDDPDTEPRCRTVLTKRQIERNSDYRLNPALRKACKLDIPKFCADATQGDPGTELEGKVTDCLRTEFQKRNSKLSPSCEKHVRGLIKEGAQDYRMDPMLAKLCGTVIHDKCAEELDDPGSGRVEECLKVHVQEIHDKKCQLQVIRLFREGLADIHVDPLLYKACALDIKHYCGGIPQGQGQQMSCLLEALDDKTLRLQPDCRRMLSERKELWEYAAQVAPLESLMDIYTQIRNSPSHNYFMLVFVSFIGILFFFGLCCGRATKRVRQEVKNK